MLANLENSTVATVLENVSFHSNPKERQCQRMFKLQHNCAHLTNYKLMLKILQTRLQQYVNCELPDGQAGFRKGTRDQKGTRGTRDQIANIHWSLKNQESSRKTSTFALLTMTETLTVWITINCGKFFKRYKYQTTWPASWKICMQVRKHQLKLGMEQQTDSE